MNLDRVVELLQEHGSKIKQLHPDQWEAQCPAHEDDKSSLSIGEGTDRKLLLHCHAGCTLEAVTAALGITVADLFPSNGHNPGDRIVNVYDYHDPDGNLIFQVVKKTGKQFVQRRPDGHGDWIWNLRGVTRVPYHLPDLTTAITAGETVFIVEGEKDADRVRTLGLTATTLPGGADKWRTEYRQWFEGARLVIILPDNDPPGQKHAATIAQALTGHVSQIKIVNLPDLPDKGDISDWLDAGNTIDDLRRVVTKPEPRHTLDELLREDLEPIRWTVEGMIPEGLTFLAGKPKLGKSWLALILALAVATGNKFLGYSTTTGTVLYIALEDGKRRIQERAIWLGALHMGNLDQFHYRTEWPTLDRGGLDQLNQWIINHPETRLIVIDTFGRLRGDLPGKDRYAEEYGLLGKLQQFAISNRIAIILIHHLRKQTSDDWLEQLSGSQAVTGAADTLLGLYRERGQMDATFHTVSRDADELELALKFNNGRWECMGPAAEYRHTVERTVILDALRDLGGQGKVGEIAALADKTTANTSKMLVKLATEGTVLNISYGVYRLVEVVEVVEPAEPAKTRLSLVPPVEVVELPMNPPPIILTSTTSTQPQMPNSEDNDLPDDYQPDPDDLPNPYEED